MSAKVLLVGWDAADWKIIEPLMERGLMPATRQLVERGVMGNMATLSPALSPMLWTSIATGKRPYKHGILGFVEPAPDGGIQPITNLARKTKAVWNILSQKGLRSNVVGWWPSHPAEPINGVMVSNRYQRAPGPIERGWPMPAGTVHPDRLAETLADLRVHPQELEPAHVLPFIPHAARIDQEKDQRLANCLRMIADCTTIQSCATHLIESEPWDLMAVYFDAIDHFCHGFIRYHPLKMDWISDEEFDLYQHVVTAGYVYHDMMLARLIELAGEGVTVILMSDHGFHPDHLRRESLPMEPAGPAAEHRDYGIFVMAGPGIKRDELIHGINLLDVTPTILTIFGLPVASDMDGRPRVDAFVEPPGVEFIESWDAVPGEHGCHPPGSHLTQADAQEGIEHLVALGYIEKPSGDIEETVREAQRELDYDLARSYMDGGLHGLAVPVLARLYDERPLDFRFGIQLALCLKSLGSVEDLERLIDDLNSRWRAARAEADKRLFEIAELARERRRLRDDASAEDRTSDSAMFSPAERDVIRKLRAIARGNPSTLDYLAGWAALEKKDLEGALTHFMQAGKSQSRVPGFHVQIGEAYLRLRRFSEAEECFQRALELDPSNAGAYVGLARTFVGLRKAREGAENATRAIQLKYHLSAGHYWLGVALAMAKEYEPAVRAFETAISQNPNFPEAHARLARIYSHIFQDEGRAIDHRVVAMQIRNERRRQRRERRIPPLPPLSNIRYQEHLPSFPVQKTAPECLVALKDAPEPRESRERESASLEPVVVVSGLPRSGTSMMMQMLLAGGVLPMTDGRREADASNPRGYFEYAKVKELSRQNDWLGEAAGKVIKIVAPLIPHLPQRLDYRVILMERDLDEIVASQRRMLQRAQHEAAHLGEAQLRLFLQQQFRAAVALLRAHRVPTLVVPHVEAYRDPALVATRVAEFLGRPLDIGAMTRTVDAELYRERGSGQARA